MIIEMSLFPKKRGVFTCERQRRTSPHLNNETIAKDVRDNCFYFTSDILKVIAGMLTIIFNRFLLEKEEELVRLHNVNRPLPCSECFLLFQPPLQRLWVHSFHHAL